MYQEVDSRGLYCVQNNFKMKSRKSRFLKQRVPTIQRMATSRGMSPRATSRNGLPVGLEECIQRLGKELACSICFSAFEDAVVTGCDHYFCERCLASALDARPSCPLCKAPVKRRELRVESMHAEQPLDHRAVRLGDAPLRLAAAEGARQHAARAPQKTRDTRERLDGVRLFVFGLGSLFVLPRVVLVAGRGSRKGLFRGRPCVHVSPGDARDARERHLDRGGDPSTWENMRTIARAEGPRALLAGAAPRLLKVAPACGIMIGSYEYAKAAFAGA